jgi:hypothetical protein
LDKKPSAVKDKIPTINPTKPSIDSSPKKKLSSLNPSWVTNRVTGSLKRLSKKSRTKIVVPNGRNIRSPVRNAFRNLRDKDVVLVGTFISLICRGT